ncbi:Zn-dependent protease with chaperone function [Peribacillus deserti]|uniref:Zn-dependent protease with chaperone function n=1 Tax=Peribacillus deserti TaxID=673318 RepID=A0ABS2QMP6_9BACI|nr:M48 family metallopeptidase [Peribacillus deserti]MBM7694019.1 Zn-dependent protease with chaperone function [Peribacillus deserti]
MSRKWASRTIIVYLIFIAAIYWYLFYGADTEIPAALKGTSADPAVFLNGREQEISSEYSKIRNFLFFLSTPYEWVFYMLILLAGLPRLFERWAQSSSKKTVVQNGIFLFWISASTLLATMPLNYIGYRLSRFYHISTQTVPSWMKDELIGFWVNFGLMWIVLTVLYWLIRKYEKKWWLYAWLLSVPFTLFLMFIQPVIIDPLYNDFYPLKDKQLEKQILQLAAKADIPAEHVYEVNMSEKTNSMNAYVNGIGSNSRIVLWDTTLEKLSDDEILFIMAHEMGHYVEKHLYFGIAGYLSLSLAGLWLASRIMNYFIRRWGRTFKISSVSSLASFPLFLLITSVLLFISSPLANYVARYEEMRADTYAIKMTEDKEAGIHSFQELTKSGLSEVNPPFLVKLFRYTHPTMLERIQMLENWEEKN